MSSGRPMRPAGIDATIVPVGPAWLALQRLDEEAPHLAAVLVLAFDERRNTLDDASRHTEMGGRRQHKKPVPAAPSDWAAAR